MSWPSQSPMGGMGGIAGAMGEGHANGVPTQGTEYTLQGVMRFLQTEWHRHERDRNAWEIERAEMKSRIGRLEGDLRTSKRLHESLGKHVRLMEIALKRERENVKKLSNNEEIEGPKDPKELARDGVNYLKEQRSSFNLGAGANPEESEHHNPQAVDPDDGREKSRGYLSKCAQEIAYHVIPTSHPLPDLSDPDLAHGYGNPHLSQHMSQQMSQQLEQHNLEEAYFNRHKANEKIYQERERALQEREMALQNSQQGGQYAEKPGMVMGQHQFGQAISQNTVDRRQTEPQQTPITAVDHRKQAQTLEHGLSDDPASTQHSAYDNQGPQAGFKENSPHNTNDEKKEDMDGWNFDEPEEQQQQPALEPIPSHRPDTDAFPNANFVGSKSPSRGGSISHRRKSSGSYRKSDSASESRDSASTFGQQDGNFKVRFALRGHLDVIRSVIFTGGGSPSEPEICTCSDDGTIKRWIIPATYGTFGAHGPSSSNDLDITCYFTHRGHVGAVTSLAACSPSQNISNGGRALGDGWVFSGGQDASVRVWERGRVDPKATLDGHTDAVWGLCVLPGTAGSVFGDSCSHYGGADRILLASGAADGRILIWAVSAPPLVSSPQAGSRRQGGSRRANSISSGSNFPSSPQPSVATSTPFHYTLVHQIVRGGDSPSPTCISPLSLSGVNFVVSFTDASILVYDTRTGEEIVGMASLETYDGTPSTGVNSVVTSTIGFDGTANLDPNRTMADEEVVHGATGSSNAEGVIISGYEDRFIRFFDANSGQCTYTMLAHPAAIAALSLSPDGRELVSAGHDASLRFWNLEMRSCSQELTSHRLMRGEGVCAVVWSRDGRWVVSGGGDGVVKVFSR
ncbi:Striatin Pro11 [Penicillium taxi]|uniref:Striatin Pro11 n=1 Tax=Penicillium taxi TaxID=168475 RepID=UPI002544FA2E|nr:Striatin Pro11 [Penicillium taxi]KAJ5908709.1 Striatin Pro11 [Penicillium taxi]